MWYIFFFFKFIDTLKSNCVGFHQSQLQAILPKKGSHFDKKNEKIIKIYVQNIQLSYYTQIIKNKLYAIFLGGTLMTQKSEKNDIFGDFRGGNSFGEYF